MFQWLNLILTLLTIAALVQLVKWIGNRFIAPWWQRGLPKRQPFMGLMEAGFTLPPSPTSWPQTDEPATVVGLVGNVQGYAVEVSTSYTSGWWRLPFYLIRVFFNTDGLASQELVIRRQNNIDHSKYIRWNDEIKLNFTHVDEKRFANGGPLHGEAVLSSIRNLVTELQKVRVETCQLRGSKKSVAKS